MLSSCFLFPIGWSNVFQLNSEEDEKEEELGAVRHHPRNQGVEEARGFENILLPSQARSWVCECFIELMNKDKVVFLKDNSVVI